MTINKEAIYFLLGLLGSVGPYRIVVLHGHFENVAVGPVTGRHILPLRRDAAERTAFQNAVPDMR